MPNVKSNEPETSTTKSNTTLTTTTTTTDKPCELPKSSNEKSEEKREEKLKVTTTTGKPFFTKIFKRRRRSAINSCGSKRCIEERIGGLLLGSPIVAAANPNAGDASDNDRYDSQIKLSNVQSDNEAQESLRATPVKTDIFGRTQFDSPVQNDIFGKSQFNGPKLMNLFAKLPAPLMTDNLIHGNIPNIIESNENHRQPISNGFDSSQSDSRGGYSFQPMLKPETSGYELPFSYDYLPSHEFFPINSPSNNFQPSPADHEPSPPKHHDKIVIGPTAFKTTPLFEATLLAEQEPQADQEVAAILPHHESGCRCDPEQFDELLHHMQSSYKQFHSGMMQLFDTFKSQANCGSSPSIDSSSAHSHPSITYHDVCNDRNAVNADPELSLKCRRAFPDSSANPSSGFYTPPGIEIAKATGYRDQFMTYADYIKMVQNVNANPGTVFSQSQDLYDGHLGASQFPSSHDQLGDTTSQLKQHFQQNRQQEQVVASPEPIAAEPSVAISIADTEPENDAPKAKAPFKFRLDTFLDKFKKP